MASFLSHMSPIPSFPAYTGPYKVGTQEIEIPVSELSSPSPAPDTNISTVSFRIFYPCEAPVKHSKPVYWLPSPQTQYFRAYLRFLSASHRLAAFLSYLPIFRTIFYTTIPALRDAKLALPPSNVEKWPVMIFSHGLGGSRNAYSHITGSLASHGMVVIAPEHRDGSVPISFIRNLDGTPPKTIDYISLPHKSTPEVDIKRTQQLKIRLWELGLIHDALLKIDDGIPLTNLASEKGPHKLSPKEQGFTSHLDVHTPGKISWCGHSFGAATVVQFLKSTYYPPPPNAPSDSLLYTPTPSSPITKQITPSTPLFLLDLWALPLQLPHTSHLLPLPLPSYQDPHGTPPLAILSEAFYKWSSNLHDTKTALSPPSSSTAQTPQIFYPLSSAHLSQSDFGPLFPYLTRKVFKADSPDRTLRLNVRAILESLRRTGIKVADTSIVDMEMGDGLDGVHGMDGVDGGVGGVEREFDEKMKWPMAQDHEILAGDGRVRGWVSVPLDGRDGEGRKHGGNIRTDNPNEAVMEGEVMKS